MNEPLLTPEQRAAVETTDSAVVLTAAAGSGKTTVLVERYVHCILRGIKPAEILMVTFTNEAADQLRQRITRRLQPRVSAETLTQVEQSPYIGTLHGFCYRIVDQYGSVANLPAVESILTPFETTAWFETNFQAWLSKLAEPTIQKLLALFTLPELKIAVRQYHYEQRRLDRASREIIASERQLFEQIFIPFQQFEQNLAQHLRATGAYGFDDLENGAIDILKSSPEISLRLRQQFKAICVDEFQDTSAGQWELINYFCDSQDSRLFVVGDPKQSIYRFRHADVKVFLSVRQAILEAGGQVQELTINFRSSPELIEAINRISITLFENSDIPFSHMQSGREPTAVQSTAFQVLHYPGLKIQMQTAEMQAVANAVKGLLSQECKPSEIALLFRVGDRIHDYLEYMRSTGIPVSGKRSQSLFDDYAILDIAHYLRLLRDPLDDLSFGAFLRSPYLGWSYQQLAEIRQRSGESLFEKVYSCVPPELRWLFALVESNEWRLPPLLEQLFAHSRYRPHFSIKLTEFLAALFKTPLTLNEAIARIDVWEKEGVSISVQDDLGFNDCVQLMTVHAAKGLEFEHVFLVDNLRSPPRRVTPFRVEEGFPPALRYRAEGNIKITESYEKIGQVQDLEDREESKRILYVAMTRAKTSLSILLPADLKLIPRNCWGELLQEPLGLKKPTG